MPMIKSAKKKLKQDKKRTTDNKRYKKRYKEAMKKAHATAGAKDRTEVLKKAYSAVDKAVKKGLIHKRRAARLKSQIAKSKKKS